MNIDNEKEKFEAHIRKSYQGEHETVEDMDFLLKLKGKFYREAVIQGEWQGWQARAKQSEAEIAELKCDHKTTIDAFLLGIECHKKEIAELKAQFEALSKDAERYRKFKRINNQFGNTCVFVEAVAGEFITIHDVDKYIDQAKDNQ